MSVLYVRNFPQELHCKIRNLAARRHRSVGAEVIVLVEQALKQETIQEQRSESLKNIAKRRRSHVSSSESTDSLTLLREDRSR